MNKFLLSKILHSIGYIHTHTYQGRFSQILYGGNIQLQASWGQKRLIENVMQLWSYNSYNATMHALYRSSRLFSYGGNFRLNPKIKNYLDLYVSILSCTNNYLYLIHTKICNNQNYLLTLDSNYDHFEFMLILNEADNHKIMLLKYELSTTLLPRVEYPR